MDYTLNQAGGVVSTAEELHTRIAIREAKRQGHEFIELYYNQDLISNADFQAEVRVNGVQAVRVYTGRDNKNLPKYDIVVAGGQLVFQWNPDAAEWVGEMLDDETDGLYGEVGYNRDFLASHFETGEFIIKDKRIECQIKSRLEKIKKIRHEKELARIDEDSAALEALKEEQARVAEKIKKAEELREKLKTRAAPGTVVEKETVPTMEVRKDANADNKTGSRVD